MDLPLYQVDAFTDSVFGGNPAAVCPLEQWLPDATLQSIAAENNLSETAFLVGAQGSYDLRWFTPTCEVELCGHATLASAFVVFRHIEPDATEVRFESRSGPLRVERRDDLLVLDFPSQPPTPCADPDELARGLGAEPVEVLTGPFQLAVFRSESDVRGLEPDFTVLGRLELAVIATAPGDAADFVSRCFAPQFGIPEDPVTGSAHCVLTPYWSRRLEKTELVARQVSSRGGDLLCELRGHRVRIAGRVAPFLRGTIEL